MTRPASSLRPVRGSAVEILELLRAWNAEVGEPLPLSIQTSGSTGAPKRVVLSRAAMRASAYATAERLGGPGQWLLNLPPSYVAGVQVLFRSVLAGTEPVLQDAGFATAAAQMVGPRRYVSLVPTQLVRILDCPADLHALRGFDRVLVGGARLDTALRVRAEQEHVHLVTTYGMSETCGGCVYDGLPLDGVAVAIGADGRIRLGGPVLFEEYDEEPELTDQVKHGGWFLTSDEGRLDEDGLLHVRGRIDDVAISGGVKVSVAAVADRLAEHPLIEAAEVVGVPDEEWGQRVVAVVVPVDGAQMPSLDALRDFVAVGHPRSWSPREIVRASRMPLLDNGKVDRRAIARLATERGRAGAAQGTQPRRGVGVGSVFSIPMTTRFRGITIREGMLIHGTAGWGEFSPFLEYDARVAAPWWRAALEAAYDGWPAPQRSRIPVNVTVPAVGPEQAARIVRSSNGCRTAKVKVAEPGQDLADAQARLEAVRDALGPEGRIRVDANGLWSVDQAIADIAVLDRAAGGLEYVEQPCASVEELALVRRKVNVPIAADESIRRAADPYRVRDLEAADIAVLKVQPLGGVRACLRIAADIGLPVVVSSALESSIGIAAGVALAAALPELPYACGLATVQLLADDVVANPLLPVDGALSVVRPDVDPAALTRLQAAPERVAAWKARVAEIDRFEQDQRR